MDLLFLQHSLGSFLHLYSRERPKAGTVFYEGFCIDLLNKLAEELRFTYEIYDSPDGNFGAEINGKWNGMIREVMDKVLSFSNLLSTIQYTSMHWLFVLYYFIGKTYVNFKYRIVSVVSYSVC